MKKNIFIGGLTILVACSATLWYNSKQLNKKIEANIKKEAAKVDSLSAINRQMADTEKKLFAKIDSGTKKINELDVLVAQANTKLATKERDLRKVKQANAQNTKKFIEWEVSKKQWEAKNQELAAANEKMLQQNNHLLAQISSLTETNHQLTDQLAQANALAKDNITVEAFAKNGKPHAKARKIKKINMAFTTYAELKSPTFKIYDQAGTLLPDSYGSFQFKLDKENSGNPAALKLEMTYLLSKRIKKGLYRVDIANENKHVGSLFVRFR
ncbi:MAG: hypothetical protein JSS93_11770 [Bacteroidetes bacterium]|nr:hypothetical protein [Bacteroidota bacterium]